MAHELNFTAFIHYFIVDMILAAKDRCQERILLKNRLARRLYDKHGMDLALCRTIPDQLEAALFGEASEAPETAVDPTAVIGNPFILRPFMPKLDP